jgi:hypothetical protein
MSFFLTRASRSSSTHEAYGFITYSSKDEVNLRHEVAGFSDHMCLERSKRAMFEQHHSTQMGEWRAASDRVRTQPQAKPQSLQTYQQPESPTTHPNTYSQFGTTQTRT